MEEKQILPPGPETQVAPETPRLNLLRRFNLKLWGVIIAVALGGILALRFIGGDFIREITQEVKVEQGEITSSQVGLPAPYFELSDLEGKKVKISDFLGKPFDSAQGKPVVLIFWSSWNQASLDQLKILDDYFIQRGEELFGIITVNNQEDRSVVSNFARRGGYSLRIILDENGAVGESYRVKTLPIIYFLDREGIIRDIYTGTLDANQIVDKVGRILSAE